ncbi:putative HTH-type transcriptional regulator YjiR [Pseudomonas fluorescens]|uniref:Putative HTH-type transcriptional regulator YjiR n=1 Tax=Pseudomonas fluorescens TaxID=294 RepID=A0A109LI18_PSEFL|nr:putative HTH-type transcriptional regulator YjiR [Pseudomonas fluorescens]
MFSPGFEPLRRQVAIRMRDAGVVVDPSEVVITHGCVDALQMSLRVLTRPGDLIAAESPTYYGLLQLADLLGLKVIEIPSDPATGMSLEALQLAANQWSIKALVLTTRLSNPLGAPCQRSGRNSCCAWRRTLISRSSKMIFTAS